MLTENEEQILQIFASVIPKLTESKKEYLRGIGEGIALIVDRNERMGVIKTE